MCKIHVFQSLVMNLAHMVAYYDKELVKKPSNIKGTNQDHMIYVEKATPIHNLLFCAHKLWLNSSISI